MSRGRVAAIGTLVSNVLLVSLAIGAVCAGVDPFLPSVPAPAELEGLSRVVAGEVAAGHVPGAVVLVGSRDRIVYERAFGDRALVPARLPMTVDTVFDLASLTKVVATATAVMQLVEAGKLALDAPVASYWPTFGLHGKERITVRELLAHESGLRPDLDLRTRWSGYDGALAEIVADRPLAPAGTRFLYGDVNFVVLGELVRRVSGEPLDRYCATHIFEPLGMDHTAFRPPAAWRDAIAPTTRVGGELLRGRVHDPMARRMGGVAGHAGLFSTARDLAVFAQMMLDGGASGGTRILEAATVSLMTAPQGPRSSSARRGLGWDLEVPGLRHGRVPFSERAYGHTGYTGTSLWIDPSARAYVVVLTNRVHPDDRGDVRPLRAHVAALVADAFSGATTVGSPAQPPAIEAIAVDTDRARDDQGSGADGGPPPRADRVETGLDVLAAEGFAPLAGRRVGLVTNDSARDAAGRRSIEVLRGAAGVTLAALFAPEHGLDGTADGVVPSSFEPSMRVPIHSLYGAVKRPTPAMLAGIDALVFDVQDAGVRFYTYVTTMAYVMEAAARAHIPFYVLDRPNPIDATVVQGPILDPDLRSFTGYFPLPVRYGMTIGELAQLLNRENAIGAELHVVRMRGYARDRWYDQTGLPWIAPSPNLRSVLQATLYPGVALVEGANVSVGRGTASPFEVVGAPWIDGVALASYLNRRDIAGVRFEPAVFVPSRDAYAGTECRGVRLVLVDRARLDAPALGVEIASALHRLSPARFALDATLGMVGARWVVDAIRNGDDPADIARRWQSPLARFRAMREGFLLY